MKHSQARRSSFSVHDKSFSEKKNKMVTFTLEKANWLGFDLDHTLVEYEMKVYEQIIFKAAYTYVVTLYFSHSSLTFSLPALSSLFSSLQPPADTRAKRWPISGLLQCPKMCQNIMQTN